MKRNFQIYGTLLAVALMFASCFEDKGNYDYADPGEVVIDMKQTAVFQAILGEPLVISPDLTLPEGASESDYRYEWYVNGKLYSEDRDLTFMGTTIDTDWCIYSVIHKRTETRTDKTFTVNVKSLYSDGWCILSRGTSGESVLGMMIKKVIDGEDVYIPYRDIYNNEGEPMGTDPVGLVTHVPELLVMQRGGRGAVEMSGNTMNPVIFVHEEFVNDTPPAGFDPVDAYYARYNANVILSSDGKVYLRYGDNAEHINPYNNQPMAMDRNARITRLIKARAGYYVNHILFYDAANKRILCFAMDAYGVGAGSVQLVDGNFTYPDNYVFTKLSDLGDMDLVYAGGITRGQYMGYVMVLKDDSGTYYTQQFGTIQDPRTDVFTMSLVAQRTEIPLGGAVLTDKSLFVNWYNANYIFFTAGANNDQLWFYNFGNPTSAAKLVNDFSGKAINALETENLTGASKLGLGFADGDFVLADIPYNYHTDVKYTELCRLNFGPQIVSISHKPSYFN